MSFCDNCREILGWVYRKSAYFFHVGMKEFLRCVHNVNGNLDNFLKEF